MATRGVVPMVSVPAVVPVAVVSGRRCVLQGACSAVPRCGVSVTVRVGTVRVGAGAGCRARCPAQGRRVRTVWCVQLLYNVRHGGVRVLELGVCV